MTYIRTIAEADAEGELADLHCRLAYPDGTVDESFKALSLNPDLLAADAALYDTVMYGVSPLSRAERQLIALTVSRLNGCERCVEHHAARYGALTGGVPGDSDRERALLAFATDLTEAPSTIGAADVERLHAAGFDDRAILDATNVVAYFNYANRVTLGLGVGPPRESPGERASREG
jgi:uncharacterized peroxidase-related enzyme